MKKVFIIFALLAFAISFTGCGGGGGSMDSPKGENPGKATLVELTPTHFISHTNSDITLHARVLDGNGNPVKNKPVRFTNLSPIGVLDKITDNTDGAGIATVTLHSHEVGFATIQAEVDEGLNQVRDKKTVFFSSYSLLLLPSIDLDVDGDNDGIYNESSDFILFETANDNQVRIRATVFDRFGQRQSGLTVTFGSDSAYRVGAATTCSDGTNSCEVSFPLGNTAVTDSSGEASVFVKIDPITIRDVQTVLNIFASCGCNGAASMVSLFLQPVTVANVNVSANPAILAPADTSEITASVILNTGGPAPDGTAVSFVTTCGAVEPFAQTTGGVAAVQFTAPETEGTCTITATSGGVTDTVDILVVTELAVYPKEQEVTVDGATDGTATFTVFGGVPPYTVFTSNPAFPADPTNITASGNTFTVAVPADSCPTATGITYTIRDSAGDTFDVTLTISSILGAPSLSITPSTICENDATCPAGTESAAGTIVGGIPPINTVSSNIAVVPSPGAAILFTIDAIDGSVTGISVAVDFTTTDHCGQTATGKVTVTGQ
jgi:hypothetical protein